MMDEGSETTASSGAASLAWASQIPHCKNIDGSKTPVFMDGLILLCQDPYCMMSKGGFSGKNRQPLQGSHSLTMLLNRNHLFAQQLDIFGDLQTAPKFPSVVVP